MHVLWKNMLEKNYLPTFNSQHKTAQNWAPNVPLNEHYFWPQNLLEACQLSCFLRTDTHLHTLLSICCQRIPDHRQEHRSCSSERWCCHRGGTGHHFHSPSNQEDKLHWRESTTPFRHCKNKAATGVQSCPSGQDGNTNAIPVLPTWQNQTEKANSSDKRAVKKFLSNLTSVFHTENLTQSSKWKLSSNCCTSSKKTLSNTNWSPTQLFNPQTQLKHF